MTVNGTSARLTGGKLHRQENPFQKRKEKEGEHKANLRKAAENWNGEVSALLEGLDDPE